MCFTSAPAHLSKTIVYAGEADHNGKMVHVIGYQNQAESLVPNAMILPFPNSQPMTQDNIVDTRSCPNVLKTLETYACMDHDGFSRSLSLNSTKSFPTVQVFDSGSYTVVLASSASAITQEHLSQVPVEKRPVLTDKFLEDYEALYPGWAVAICCWAGKIKAEPLLWWYESRYPEYLFAPGFDAHGVVPNKIENVMTDHSIIFQLKKLDKMANDIYYPKMEDSIRKFLPDHAMGEKFHKLMKNGDFVISRNAKSFSELERVPPPGLE